MKTATTTIATTAVRFSRFSVELVHSLLTYLLILQRPVKLTTVTNACRPTGRRAGRRDVCCVVI